MKILFILNEAPYGSEKTYNALRLAMALQKDQPGTELLVFLMADAVSAALPAQTTPKGYYNVERMLKSVVSKGGLVRLCGACSEARGIKAILLLEGAEISTMSQLTQWTVEADKVLVFWLCVKQRAPQDVHITILKVCFRERRKPVFARQIQYHGHVL